VVMNCAALPGPGDLLCDLLALLDLVGNESRAPLEAHGAHGHLPAIAQAAHDVAERDAHFVVKYLRELGLAVDLADRPDLDSWRVHVADHPTEAAVALRSFLGAQDKLLPIGDVGKACPDLRAIDDQLVPFDTAPGADAGK